MKPRLKERESACVVSWLMCDSTRAPEVGVEKRRTETTEDADESAQV
jgi:hypothetical protein